MAFRMDKTLQSIGRAGWPKERVIQSLDVTKEGWDGYIIRSTMFPWKNEPVNWMIAMLDELVDDLKIHHVASK